MKVTITGARGLLGKALSQSLKDKGHDVHALSIRVPELPNIEGDIVFHLAHDHNPSHADDFSNWMMALEKFWQPRFKRQIYISSYSARPDALSVYGKTKYKIEQHFLKNNHAIIRPGLILGQGGTFGAMLKMLKLSPFIAVPGGNESKVPVVSCSYLCNTLKDFPKDEHNIFCEELIGLSDLLQKSTHQLNLKRLFVPFPARMALYPLKALEAVGLHLPVSSDNLRGLISNQNQIHFPTRRGETLEQALRTLQG